MGDNASVKDREWHNTIVGQGYQARGVIRQPGLQPVATKIVDMTGKTSKTTSAVETTIVKETITDDNSSKSESGHKKHKRKDDKKEKSKKESKHKKKHRTEKDNERDVNDRESDNTDRFNPLIQLLLSKFPN